MGLRRTGIALLVAACLLVGCGGDESGESASAAGGAAKAYSVGIVGFAAADQTSQQAIKGYSDAAAKKGWKVTVVDAQGAPDKAVAAMQNFVQKDVDLILTTVFPSNSLTAGALAAKAAGIPVVSLAGGTADGIQVNWDAGTASGKAIAGRLLEDTGGKGALLKLGYKLGLPCLEREEVLDAALKGTGVEVTRNEVPIPGQVEASTSFTRAWLAKRPGSGEELAIWGCFDDPALGAIAAIKQASRHDVRVYGVNGQSAALKAIQAGDMDATVWLDVYATGRLIAERTPSYVEAGVDAEPTDAPFPSVLVHQGNVERFLDEHPRAAEGL